MTDNTVLQVKTDNLKLLLLFKALLAVPGGHISSFLQKYIDKLR
jgi:hypothetical protein